MKSGKCNTASSATEVVSARVRPWIGHPFLCREGARQPNNQGHEEDRRHQKDLAVERLPPETRVHLGVGELGP